MRNRDCGISRTLFFRPLKLRAYPETAPFAPRNARSAGLAGEEIFVRADNVQRTCCETHRARRARWSRSELQDLERWAGVWPVAVLCRRLHRSERAVRCQLCRRGLSARVCEGVEARQLPGLLHLPARTIAACIARGALRLHSATIHGRTAGPPSDHPRWSLRRWFVAAQRRDCRLTHLRVSETSLRRFVAGDTGRAAGARLDADACRWLGIAPPNEIVQRHRERPRG